MLESYKWMVGWLSDCAYSKSTCGANNETTTSYRCIFIPQKSARSQQLSHMVCLRSLVKQWLFSKTVHPDISWFIVFINIPWLYSLNSSCNIKCNFTHDWMKVGRRITHFWRRGKRGGFPENESDSDFHIARFGSVGCTVVCLRLVPGKSTPKPLLRAAGVDCFHLRANKYEQNLSWNPSSETREIWSATVGKFILETSFHLRPRHPHRLNDLEDCRADDNKDKEGLLGIKYYNHTDTRQKY